MTDTHKHIYWVQLRKDEGTTYNTYEFQLKYGSLSYLFITMPKRKDNVSTEEETVYTLDSMTCRILLDLQAREYIVKSSSKPINIIDLIIWLILLYLMKVKYFVLLFIRTQKFQFNKSDQTV